MGESIRVVLVDDHRILREGVRRLLSEWPGAPAIEVAGEADSGNEAVPLLQRLAPEVAVIDLALPGLGGVEVCRLARGMGIRVVVLSMHASVEHVRQARGAGAGAYVVKGAGTAELADAIRQVASGREGPFPETGPDPLALLTAREREVLIEVARGRTNRAIARALGISAHTVNTHRTHLMDKLEVHDAIALARLAVRAGLLPS